jgi:6-phosphofructo-2-kinase
MVWYKNGLPSRYLGRSPSRAETIANGSSYTASASSVLLRQKILRKCREDIYHFFDRENGQVAIYDAVNPLAAGRRSLAKEFAKHEIQVMVPAFRYYSSTDIIRPYSSNLNAPTSVSSRRMFAASRSLHLMYKTVVD